MNISHITPEKVQELKNTAKSQEVNAEANPITPRTKFAMNKLGYQVSDLSSINHEFKYDAEDDMQKGNRMVEEYMYWEGLIHKLSKLQKFRQHVIDENLLPVNDQQQKLNSDMEERLTKANKRYTKIIDTYQRQAKSVVNVEKLTIEKHVTYNNMRAEEKQQAKRKYNEKQKQLEIVRHKRLLEANKIKQLKESRIADEIKRANLSRKWRLENQRGLKETQSKKSKSHEATLKRSFNATLQKAKDSVENRKQRHRQQTYKEQRMNSLYKLKLVKQQELSQNKANKMRSKLQNRLNAHQQKYQELKEQERIRNQNLLAELHLKEVHLQQKQMEREKENQAIAQERNKHRRAVKQNFETGFEEAIKSMQKRQNDAEARRYAAHLEQQKQAGMRRTLYRIKKDQAFDRMKQYQRAKEFQNKLLAEKLRNLDERYTVAKRVDNNIKWYTLQSRDNAKFKFDEKLEEAAKANHDLDRKAIKKLATGLDDEQFDIEKLSKPKMDRMLKHTSQNLNSVPSGVEHMTKHKIRRFRTVMNA